MKYLALGDSYTIGEGVAYSENFPSLFVALSKSENKIFHSFEIIAKTGWRSDELLTKATENQTNDYDLITLLIGVNNQYQHKDMGDFISDFKKLIELALSKVKNKNLVILTIPDYSFTPFGVDFPQASAEIDNYNLQIQKITLSYKIPVVDINPITKTNDLSYVTHDQLHPSPKMYTLWAKKLLEQQLSLNPTKDIL